MSRALATDALAARVEELSGLRSRANAELFGAEAERIARCCRALAERFAAGGRLLAAGTDAAARSDARHVAVEFVHPVIVGKRALPAVAVGGAEELALLASPPDAAIGFGADAGAAIAAARERGCLTIGFGDGFAEWDFPVAVGDPFVAQELVETLYHVLWELVHVFFERRGLGAEETGAGAAAGFLYPFLDEGEDEGEDGAVLADVRASVLAKADEVGELRERTLAADRAAICAAAVSLRARFEAGGKVLAFGNGGSATDAADFVADLREPPAGWKPRPALDLSEDPAILTAIANDVGADKVFSRQVIAHGREGDVAVAISTSGDSANLVEALGEARRRGMETVALLGYAGGRVAAEGLADRVIIARSQHIPRIQEAQASVYHVLRELIELA